MTSMMKVMRLARAANSKNCLSKQCALYLSHYIPAASTTTTTTTITTTTTKRFYGKNKLTRIKSKKEKEADLFALRNKEEGLITDVEIDEAPREWLTSHFTEEHIDSILNDKSFDIHNKMEVLIKRDQTYGDAFPSEFKKQAEPNSDPIAEFEQQFGYDSKLKEIEAKELENKRQRNGDPDLFNCPIFHKGMPTMIDPEGEKFAKFEKKEFYNFHPFVFKNANELLLNESTRNEIEENIKRQLERENRTGSTSDLTIQLLTEELKHFKSVFSPTALIDAARIEAINNITDGTYNGQIFEASPDDFDLDDIPDQALNIVARHLDEYGLGDEEEDEGEQEDLEIANLQKEADEDIDKQIEEDLEEEDLEEEEEEGEEGEDEEGKEKVEEGKEEMEFEEDMDEERIAEEEEPLFLDSLSFWKRSKAFKEQKFNNYSMNVLQHPELFSTTCPQTINEADVDKMYYISSADYNAYFGELGMGGELDRTFDKIHQRALLIRKPIIPVIQYLEQMKKQNFKSRDLDTKGFVFTGIQGGGKSACLATVVHHAFKNNFMVFYIPSAHQWTHGTHYVEPSILLKGYFDTPTPAIAFMKHFGKANSAFLKEMRLSKNYNLPIEIGEKQPTTLADLINYGVLSEENAAIAFKLLLDELYLNNDVPMLFAIDDYNFFLDYTNFTYGNLADFDIKMPEKVHATQLTLVRGLNRILLQDKPNTIFVAATSKKWKQENELELEDYLLKPLNVSRYNPNEMDAILEYYQASYYVFRDDGEPLYEDLVYLTGAVPEKIFKELSHFH
jgi:hypothetical protein